jgi:hypothetical protein
LHFVDDSGHFSPEARSLTGDTFSFAGDGDVLARKSSRNDVNTSSPGPAVKRTNVIPDREWVKASVVLSSDQDRLAVRILFDGTHSSPTK